MANVNVTALSPIETYANSVTMGDLVSSLVMGDPEVQVLNALFAAMANAVFYVYFLVDSTLVPASYRTIVSLDLAHFVSFCPAVFYIIKGKKSRMRKHASKVRALWKRNGMSLQTPPQVLTPWIASLKNDKQRRISEIWVAGGEVHCLRITRNVNEGVAFNTEASLITFFGKDYLTNQIAGTHVGYTKAVKKLPNFKTSMELIAKYRVTTAAVNYVGPTNFEIDRFIR